VSKRGYRPQRTCLGCGERDAQKQLIRLVVTEDGQLKVGESLQRGGYLHRRSDCWRMFVNRKSHYRGFHVEVSRSAKEKLIEELKERDGE
jgi:predicted RNA-binding protein YlxR (DUF448 family)